MRSQVSGCALGEDAVCAPTTGPCLSDAANTVVSTRGVRVGPVWNESVLDQAGQATGLVRLSYSSNAQRCLHGRWQGLHEVGREQKNGTKVRDVNGWKI